MKILKIIHGYPPEYNAGSEIYSQTLCNALSKTHEVHVFTREENPFLPDYTLRSEPDVNEPKIIKHTVNIPLLRHRYRYKHEEVDAHFAMLLDKINPDIIHVGHLNHLSISLLEKIKNIPIVFTLHDYWLVCPRGQFIQRNPQDPLDVWKECDGQENRKCAERCYSGYFSGDAHEWEEDTQYWTNWVARRQSHLKRIFELVDVFIAPSYYLLDRFKKETQLPADKFIYLDYGFDLARLSERKRQKENNFVFGYIGTHTPQKGIHLLIHAFGKVKGNCTLKIWGRARAETTSSLKQIAESLPEDVQHKIEWLPEYSNDDIVSQVFNTIDALVVPSIWVENSPLVLHEAQHAGVPTITADVGGMCEFVEHEKNGLLFKFRDEESLTSQMQRLLDNPDFAKELAKARYLYSEQGDIPDIKEHVQKIEEIYGDLILKKKEEKRYENNKAWPMAHNL